MKGTNIEQEHGKVEHHPLSVPLLLRRFPRGTSLRGLLLHIPMGNLIHISAQISQFSPDLFFSCSICCLLGEWIEGSGVLCFYIIECHYRSVCIVQSSFLHRLNLGQGKRLGSSSLRGLNDSEGMQHLLTIQKRLKNLQSGKK